MASKYDSGPFTGGFAITPGTALTKPVRGLLVTGAGNVNITMIDGSSVTVPVAANVIYNFTCTAVASSGTTATGIFGFY